MVVTYNNKSYETLLAEYFEMKELLEEAYDIIDGAQAFFDIEKELDHTIKWKRECENLLGERTW